jgi:hypothetical protein
MTDFCRFSYPPSRLTYYSYVAQRVFSLIYLLEYLCSRVQGLLVSWGRILPGFFQAEKLKSKQKKAAKLEENTDPTKDYFFLMDLRSLECQVLESFRSKGVEAFLDLFEYNEVTRLHAVFYFLQFFHF